jgi:uncharacterized protein
VLVLGHDVAAGTPLLTGWVQVLAGISAGFGIGIVASRSLGRTGRSS